VYIGCWWGKLREGNHLEDPGIDGKIILRWLFKEVGCKGRDWIDVAQYRETWRAFVNAVKNFRVP